MYINELSLLSKTLLVIGILNFLLLLFSSIISYRENERRAAVRLLLLSVILPLPFLIIASVSFIYQSLLSVILLLLTVIVILLLIIPMGKKHITEDDTPKSRIDERDVMFSRNLLEPGSQRFEEYYQRCPEKRELDDSIRKEPGYLSKGSKYYDPYLFSATAAGFTTIRHLRQHIDGDHADEKIKTDPEKITCFIKSWAKKMGAVSVGVTELKDYHLYATNGRGDDYGKPVTCDHKYAIALTVEMGFEMMQPAPLASAAMETAQKYLVCGFIAFEIAEFIRNLGYPARAHIDGRYYIVCPLVARDAGLGEIGRMGLLMTPKLGPRVRIAVVSTDLPLITDKRTFDYSVIDFCTQCKKCADVCPSRAIPFDDRKEINGVKRWQINQEKCFTMWCRLGTDCSRCASVCPYSHPDNFLHNLIRKGIRNSSIFRKAALQLDDFFYGRKPAPKELPEWMRL